MALTLVRVDDRLVHGQVMVGWRSHLGATRVLVASDRLAANATACSILQLTAAPEAVVVVDTVAGLVPRIAAGEFDGDKVILLFESLGDLRRALDLGLRCERLNIGGIRHHDSCIAFTPAVSLSEEDVGQLREIMARGIDVDIQMVPLDRTVHLEPAMFERRAGG